MTYSEPSVTVGRCYERSPKWPTYGYHGDEIEVPSPDGKHRLVFHSPHGFAMGASWYQLKIEINGKEVVKPPRVVYEDMYANPHPMRSPWSFDSRYAFISEAPYSWRHEHQEHRSVEARTWCLDTAMLPENPLEAFKMFFTPQHKGAWSPCDYRVLNSTKDEIHINDAFGTFSSSWRRYPVQPTNYEYWDRLESGWLLSGRVVWSACAINGGSSYGPRTVVRFDDVMTGRCLLEYNLKPEDVLGRESPDGRVAVDPPLQRVVMHDDDPEPWAEIVEDPPKPAPPGVKPALKSHRGELVQRIYCRLGKQDVWLEVIESQDG